MEEEKLKNAREFCGEVKKLAEKRKLSFFVVTEGASATSNQNCEAVRNAREKHIEWELQNGFDPYEDWQEEN